MGVLYAKVNGAWEPILNSTGSGGGPPIGVLEMWGGTLAAIPPKYLPCDGTTRPIASFPDLATVLGTAWGPNDGTNFTLPNFVDCFAYGGTAPGAAGGSADAVVISHFHTQPTHTHTLNNHTHGAGTLATSSAGNHDHTVSFNQQSNTTTGGTAPRMSGLGTALVQTSSVDGAHTHDVTGSTAANNGNTGADGNENTGTTGVAGTGLNLPPFKRVLYIIKALL